MFVRLCLYHTPMHHLILAPCVCVCVCQLERSNAAAVAAAAAAALSARRHVSQEVERGWLVTARLLVRSPALLSETHLTLTAADELAVALHG